MDALGALVRRHPRLRRLATSSAIRETSLEKPLLPTNLRVSGALFALGGLPGAAGFIVGAVPGSNATALKPDRGGCELVEKKAVVGDDDPDAVESVQRPEKQLSGLDVEVVGRLVEEEKSRGDGQRCSYLPALSLSRRKAPPPHECIGLETKIAENAMGLAFLRRGEVTNLASRALDRLRTDGSSERPGVVADLSVIGQKLARAGWSPNRRKRLE
jgi:hypothetical protein